MGFCLVSPALDYFSAERIDQVHHLLCHPVFLPFGTPAQTQDIASQESNARVLINDVLTQRLAVIFQPEVERLDDRIAYPRGLQRVDPKGEQVGRRFQVLGVFAPDLEDGFGDERLHLGIQSDPPLDDPGTRLVTSINLVDQVGKLFVTRRSQDGQFGRYGDFCPDR